MLAKVVGSLPIWPRHLLAMFLSALNQEADHIASNSAYTKGNNAKADTEARSFGRCLQGFDSPNGLKARLPMLLDEISPNRVATGHCARLLASN
jgi:hypothetical protein